MEHSARRTASPATYQDVLDAPKHLVAELIGGELYTSPRPAMPHALTSSDLTIDLGAPFRRGRGGPGGWWIVAEPELHLGDEVLVPDVAAWRRERMPERPSGAFVSLVPDWVCEIASPSTRSFDRLRKMPVYLRHGLGFLWLVEPLERFLDAFVREGERWVLLGTWSAETEARIPPFDAVPLDVTGWWASDDETGG
ncbi:MAG: Uma2 family endonuclease [Myxococcota bacterium]|jgi:Uma2 family endonuclease|nr:Uma2 family endonuclease [Myxococcota bacterium]